MICKKCGKEHEGDRTFCSNCGHKLQEDIICGHCQELNAPYASFCRQCGLSLKEKQEITEVKKKERKKKNMRKEGKSKVKFVLISLALLLLITGSTGMYFFVQAKKAATEEASKILAAIRNPEDEDHEIWVKKLSLDKLKDVEKLETILERVELRSGTNPLKKEIVFYLPSYKNEDQETALKEAKASLKAFSEDAINIALEKVKGDEEIEVSYPLEYSFINAGEEKEIQRPEEKVVIEVEKLVEDKMAVLEPLHEELRILTKKELLKSLEVTSEEELLGAIWITSGEVSKWAVVAQKVADKEQKLYYSSAKGVQELLPGEVESAVEIKEVKSFTLPNKSGLLLAVKGVSGNEKFYFIHIGDEAKLIVREDFLNIEEIREGEYVASKIASEKGFVAIDNLLYEAPSNRMEERSIYKNELVTEDIQGKSRTYCFLKWEENALVQTQGRRITSETFRKEVGGNNILDTLHENNGVAYSIYAFPGGNYHVNSYIGSNERRYTLNYQFYSFVVRDGKIHQILEDKEGIKLVELDLNQTTLVTDGVDAAGYAQLQLNEIATSTTPQEADEEITFSDEEKNTTFYLTTGFGQRSNVSFVYDVYSILCGRLQLGDYPLNKDIKDYDQLSNTVRSHLSTDSAKIYILSVKHLIDAWYAATGETLSEEMIEEKCVVRFNQQMITNEDFADYDEKIIYLKEEGVVILYGFINPGNYTCVLDPVYWEKDGDNIYVGGWDLYFSQQFTGLRPFSASVYTFTKNELTQTGPYSYPYRLLERKVIWSRN